MARRPVVYFSFRSPFSWMSLHRLRGAVPDLFDVVDLVPYWDPDEETATALKERDAEFHYVQMSKAKHLYILQDTKRLSQRLGLTMSWPVDVAPWWEVPHLAWLVARSHGRAEACYDAIVAARWERGVNVCEPEFVRSLGRQVGIDGDLLAGAVDDPAVRAEAVDSLVRAYGDDVFGVPYFRVGRHRFWGYDRVDDFLALALPALGRDVETEEPVSGLRGVPDEVVARVGGYDTDTAGGCG